MNYIVKNLEETKQLANQFAENLKIGDIVLLSGDLGAGKTTFTQFVFKALGVEDVVNSPTFAVLKSYQSKFCSLHHFDCYRINTEEAIECGFDEVLSDRNSIIFIEWAEMIKELIPLKHIEVKITLKENDERKFEVVGR